MIHLIHLIHKTQSSLPAAFPLVGPRFQFKFTNTNTHTDTDTHNMHMRKEAIGGTQATTGNYAHKYNIDIQGGGPGFLLPRSIFTAKHFTNLNSHKFILYQN